ncbi:MAG: PAS domain-containing protein [Blastocatellia bacterium]|nr:PAS domain-containing protein [Blastocatellia bacterium]
MPHDSSVSVPQSLDSEFWRLVIDAIPDGISVHSLDGRILYANRELADIYRKTEESLIGLGCEDMFHSEVSSCPHGEILQSGQSIRVDGNLEIEGKSYSVTVAPIFDESGRTCGYVRVMGDITERQRAQEQLLRAERFATLGQMISGIAHDVGTPLNIISGYSEYLLMRTSPDAHGYKELSTILQQTRRIAEFIKQMLDLARPAQGRADAIGLKGFLAESLNLIGHHLRRSEVEAVITCDVNPPLIYGDAPRLRQAFFNLLLNASQQVSRQGRLELIVSENSNRPGFVMIALVGTEPDGRGHDFSQTFSGFMSSPLEGEAKGFGLSLAKKILDEFGAEVYTKDMGDRGVALALYLPVTEAVRTPSE